VYGLECARELAVESHARACDALAEADADVTRLQQIADYILTRTA
jgi:hypothetical protein